MLRVGLFGLAEILSVLPHPFSSDTCFGHLLKPFIRL